MSAEAGVFLADSVPTPTGVITIGKAIPANGATAACKRLADFRNGFVLWRLGRYDHPLALNQGLKGRHGPVEGESPFDNLTNQLVGSPAKLSNVFAR